MYTKKKETRTYADRAEYMRMAVKRRRKKLREMARGSRGNKCAVCGYDKCQRALNFHHIDPSKKEFDLASRGLTRSWKKIEEEIIYQNVANENRTAQDGPLTFDLYY